MARPANWPKAGSIRRITRAVGISYYAAMEKMGYAKRDILVERVIDTRKAQSEAKDQFASALTHLDIGRRQGAARSSACSSRPLCAGVACRRATPCPGAARSARN